MEVNRVEFVTDHGSIDKNVLFTPLWLYYIIVGGSFVT